MSSALKKARKDFKALSESERWLPRAADFEVVAAAMGTAEELAALHSAVAAGDDAADAALAAAVERAMK